VISTAILFLLLNRQFSAFHRIRSDEIWHFHCGATVLLHVLKPDGNYACIELGLNPPAALPQAVVPAGSWFAAEVKGRRGFSLVSCTVAPGFDFADFELARRNKLTKAYPAHKALIRRLTR
jgi:predicted cupin superfamily sugar epimerase